MADGHFQITDDETAYVPKTPPWQIAARAMVDLLFPPRCPVSGTAVVRQGTLAPDIWGRVRHLAPPWCDGCGWPFAYEDPGITLCATCAAPEKYADNLTGRGRLDRLRCAIAYDDVIAPGILRFKHADRLDGVATFARMMVAAGGDVLADHEALLVPVPLHAARLRQRRFNQAGVLAQAIGRLTGRQVGPRALIRHKPAPRKKGGSKDERRRNVQGAFRVADEAVIAGRRIVLIDDVVTTGATLLACTRPLRQAGAANVSALAFARVVKGAEASLYGEE